MKMSERLLERCDLGIPMPRTVLDRFMKKSGVGRLIRWFLLDFGPFREFMEEWTFFVERTTMRKVVVALDDLEGQNGPFGEAVEKSG